MSGLQVNASKSSIFIASTANALHIAAAEGSLQVQTLPIKYLGLPLTTKVMTKHDYEPLIEKVRNRFLSWTTRTLSYAGRLQLIKSVICSTVNFRSSVFILPKSCYDTIEQMCAAFLWSGSLHDSHKAKVAWTDLCLPMAEGDLGVRRLRDSSRVFALQLIWRLFTLSGSLWVAWVKRYLLKQQSFWSVKIGQKGSWIWRKLLKLRSQAYEFLRVEVRDGTTTSFWNDSWLQIGTLANVMGEAGPRLLGVPTNATVAEAFDNARWPQHCSARRTYPEVMEALLTVSHPSPKAGQDVILWRHDTNIFRDNYSSSKTWEQIRMRNASVPWAKVVWFSQNVMRYAFITWLVIRDRLSTGDRMRVWGIHQPCMLCGAQEESRDHLFFACPYSYSVWSMVGSVLFHQSTAVAWSDNLQLLSRNQYNTMDFILIRLLFQSVVYWLWRERNARKNQGQWHTTDQLAKLVEKSVRNRLTSIDYKSPHRLQSIRMRWFEVPGHP